MSNPKFTSGPWEYHPYYSGAPDEYGVGPGEFDTVAHVRRGSDGERIENPMTKIETYTDGPFTITVTRKRMGRPPKAEKAAQVAAQRYLATVNLPGPQLKRRGRPRKRA